MIIRQRDSWVALWQLKDPCSHWKGFKVRTVVVLLLHRSELFLCENEHSPCYFSSCVWLFLGKGRLLSGVSTGCLETAQWQEIVQHRTPFESGKCFNTSVFNKDQRKWDGQNDKSAVRLKGLILRRIGPRVRTAHLVIWVLSLTLVLFF